MPAEPLIFVEVALTKELSGNIQALLDEHAPVLEAERADTAIFYSISNTQAGLRGVTFGNFLLKRVIDDLKRDFPQLKTFATLSPLPQFAAWLRRTPEALTGLGLTLAQLQSGEWAQDKAAARRLRDALEQLAARYLYTVRQNGRPYDPVARFHLGNGARIERINFLADSSAKGFKQSCGLMVNYLYDPDQIEQNVEAFFGEDRIAATAAIRRLAKA
jgi:malonyl-CoA decarboxylase